MARQKTFRGYPPEEWRMITGLGKAQYGWYEVSNHGHFRHVYGPLQTRAISPFRKNTVTKGSDYYLVHILGRHYRAAVLVWEAFNGPVPEGMRVTHVNGEKANNAIWNLKLMSKSDIGRKYGGLANKSKGNIARIDREQNILGVYRSAREASEKYGCLCYQSILDRCNGKVKRDKWLPDGTTFVWEDVLFEG